MGTLGEFVGSGSGTTKLLLHLNGSSTDSSGNGNNGVDTDITYVDGKFGKCADLNGTSSYISIADSASLQFGTGDFTVSLWCKPDKVDYSVSAQGTLISKNYTGFEIYIYNSKIYVYLGGISNPVNNGTITLNTSTYYNIILTRSGSSVKIYINSVLDGTTTNSSNVSQAGTSLNLGWRPSGTSSQYQDGKFDEVIIENRAWSASEVKKYFTHAKGRFGII